MMFSNLDSYERHLRKMAKRAKKNLELDKIWFNWFAWYPVRINSTTVVWLEWVQYRCHFQKTIFSLHYGYSDNRDKPEYWERAGYEYRRITPAKEFRLDR